MRILVVATVLLTGCLTRIGPHARDYPPAMRAEGTQSWIITVADSIVGELIEVRDTALVVASPTRIALVSRRWIAGAHFGDLKRRTERPLDDREMARLRFLSRYPYGIPEAGLRALLAARNQSALEVINR